MWCISLNHETRFLLTFRKLNLPQMTTLLAKSLVTLSVYSVKRVRPWFKMTFPCFTLATYTRINNTNYPGSDKKPNACPEVTDHIYKDFMNGWRATKA